MDLKQTLKPTKNKLVVTLIIIVIGLFLHGYIAPLSTDIITHYDIEGKITIESQSGTNIIFDKARDFSPSPIHETILFGLNALALVLFTLIGLPGFIIASYFQDVFYSIPRIGIFGPGYLLYLIDLLYIYIIAAFTTTKFKIKLLK